MKPFSFFTAILFVAVSIVSCKKNSDDRPDSNPSAQIQGVWAGKFGTGNNNPTAFFSFNIKAGGILEELTATGQVKGTGTWKLENKIFYGYTINILDPIGNKYSVIGAYDASKGKILGNWGYEDEATDGGLWEMNKKQ